MPGISSRIDGVVYPSDSRARESFANGSWIDATIGDALRDTAKRLPDRPAFISDESTLTFSQLDELTERLGAALINLGLMRGDRAILQIGTNIESVVVLLACYKAGIVPVCSLPQHREVEIGQLTRQSAARGYFVQADFSGFDLIGFAAQMMERDESLSHLIVVRGESPGLPSVKGLIDSVSYQEACLILAEKPVASEDVLSFQLSGGTTGVPKIIPRFHAEYLGHSAAWMSQFEITEGNRVIWSLPIVHNAGQLYALIPAIMTGVTTVLMPKVDVQRMLELIELHRVTHALSIGPIAPQLLAYTRVQRHDLSSLKLFATMSRADLLEAHIGVPCSNLYGITEGLLLGSPASASASARHRTQGASGCPYDEVRLIDPETGHEVADGQMGEICFCGPSSLTGFYKNAEANATAFTPDGFYRTGDMMTRHVIEDRVYYAFEGRLRDNINRGGEKIGCEEVEGFVAQHAAISDAKLVAMPDEFYGEKGCVFIVPRPGMQPPNVKELAAFLIDRGLAKYKCPERIEVLDAFPVTRVGKVDKPALKKLISEKLAGETVDGRLP
ncbi:MAG: (2,3-dihydroxybenzoyl)adenylate synthase [Paraburkholderia sp.]|uniref:AMP-binding protein n=1 Tax=Paraburkholderia sp. TaxID=1926495 RepID=UPI001207967F|nr:AMP-binding protein [Paraburkholderia sp.]TAL98700.1 MAG: (2,3-dihydroxybenzoyl)adenylate synthase [Paraburkholderia sp.]